MNSSMPGLPVHHQFLECTQTHVHQVGDAIQPSHPLSSPSPPAPNPSQHQGVFQWVNSSPEVAKVLEFQLQHQSFQWTPRTVPFVDSGSYLPTYNALSSELIRMQISLGEKECCKLDFCNLDWQWPGTISWLFINMWKSTRWGVRENDSVYTQLAFTFVLCPPFSWCLKCRHHAWRWNLVSLWQQPQEWGQSECRSQAVVALGAVPGLPAPSFCHRRNSRPV